MKRVLRFRNALPFRRDSEEDCEREPSKSKEKIGSVQTLVSPSQSFMFRGKF